MTGITHAAEGAMMSQRRPLVPRRQQPAEQLPGESPQRSGWWIVLVALLPVACCAVPLLLAAGAAAGGGVLLGGVTGSVLLVLGGALAVLAVRRRTRCSTRTTGRGPRQAGGRLVRSERRRHS